MHSQIKIVLLLLAASAFMLVTIENAEAIPAFTRQHKTECSTCHTIYPELNEYGEAFQKNSYVKKSEPVAAPVNVKVPRGSCCAR